MRIVNSETVYSVARWIHAHGPVTAANRARFDALVRHTSEFLAAGMAAPTATVAVKRLSTGPAKPAGARAVTPRRAAARQGKR
jgi:hypothetical protein